MVWIDKANHELGFVRAVLDALYHMANTNGMDLSDATETMGYLISEAIGRVDRLHEMVNPARS